MTAESLQKMFIQWLERALADEQVCAFIRDRMARNTPQLTEIQY